MILLWRQRNFQRGQALEFTTDSDTGCGRIGTNEHQAIGRHQLNQRHRKILSGEDIEVFLPGLVPGKLESNITLALENFCIERRSAHHFAIDQHIRATGGCDQTHHRPCWLQGSLIALLHMPAFDGDGFTILQISVFGNRQLMLARFHRNIY